MDTPSSLTPDSTEELLTKLKVLQKENSQLQHQVTERNKELQILLKISSLLGSSKFVLITQLKEIAELIPLSMQYPEVTCVKITLNKKEYKTSNFKISKWKLSENIFINNQKSGSIDLFYLEEKPELDYGPFLNEEINLLRIIATYLSKSCEKDSLIEKLTDSEMKFSISFQNSPVAKCIVDISDNYRFIHINEKLLSLTGFSRKQIEGRFLHEIEFLSEDVRKNLIVPVVEQGETIKELELTFHNKRGELRTVIISTEVIKSNKLLLLVINDITERKENERIIKERDELNSQLINTIPYGMDIIDREGKILFVNDNFKKIFNGDIIGKTCWEVMRDDQLQCPDCPLKQNLKQGEIKICESAGIKGGRVFEINHKGIRFNDKEAVLEIFHDITERKKAENINKKHEERLQGIFDNMQDAFFLADNQGRFIFVNPMALKMFGYSSEDELLGKPATMLYAHTIERKDLFERLKKRGRLTDCTVKALKKDGSNFWVSMNIQFLYDDNKQIYGTQGIVRDITERIEFSEKLQESEKRFRDIFENMPSGYILFELIYDKSGKPADHRLIEANAEFDNQTGLKRSEQIGRTSKDLSWRWPKEVTQSYYNVALTGKSFSYERFNDSLNRHYDIRVSSPKRGQFALLFNDITNQKKAEEDRFKLLSRYKQIALHIPGFIYQYHLRNDMTSTFPYASDGIQEIYGVTPEEAMNNAQCVFDAIHPEDVERVKASIFESARSLTTWNDSYRVNLPSDKTIWIEGKSTPVKLDDGSVLWHGYIHDITERKISEIKLITSDNKLKESQALIYSIVDSTNDLIWSVDINSFGLLFYNRSFVKFFSDGLGVKVKDGMTPAELLPTQKLTDIWSGFYKQFLQNGSLTIEYKLETTERYLLLNFNLLKKGDEAFGISVFAKDITEIKLIENDLIMAKEKAEESDRLKSAFLLNISHEIRTPMNAIMGFLPLLKEGELGEQESSQYINIITNSGTRLIDTIDNIVEISKIEIGDISLYYQIVNINDLMWDAFNLFSVQAIEKGLTFSFSKQVESEYAFIKSDKHMLEVIVKNLIINAIKFTMEGKIEIGNYIEKGVLWIYVSDTGIGIPQEKHDSIFKSFVQAHTGLTRGYEGAGLGLSIVKAYAKALNGKLMVKSEEGKGSTFLFSLPYDPVIN